IHPAAVAGHSLFDALRRLDFSRSRGAARRASRIAPGVGACECAGLHDPVSFLAASRRSDHRPRGWRNGASVAWLAAPKTEASSRRGGRHRFGAGGGEHILCAAHASSRAKTAALAALAEVGGGGRPGSAVSVVANRATRPVERLRQFARRRQNRLPANRHRPGAGRCRIRQREKSHLYSSATGSAKCDPRQARKENLARARSACRDAASVSAKALPASRPDRERLLFGQTQALGARPGPQPAAAGTASPAARPEFQSVSLEASLPFPKDVNRAKPFQNPFFGHPNPLILKGLKRVLKPTLV